MSPSRDYARAFSTLQLAAMILVDIPLIPARVNKFRLTGSRSSLVFRSAKRQTRFR